MDGLVSTANVYLLFPVKLWNALALKMMRFMTCTRVLPLYIYVALISRRAGAQLQLDTDNATFPTQMTVCQGVIVAWNRTGDTEPFDFGLIYLGQTSKTTFTQLLSAQPTLTLTDDENPKEFGVISIMAKATGEVQLVAFLTKTDNQPNEALTTFTPTITVGPVAGSTPSASNTPETNIQHPMVSPTPSFTNPQTPNGNSSKAIIIGSVIGGVVFLASAVVSILLLLRHCRRRGRTDHPEGFHRDMMVSRATRTNFGTRIPKREDKKLVAKHSRHDTVSSTTPLRGYFGEDEEDDETSSFTSIYSFESSSKQSLATSGISSTSAASSDGESDTFVTSLIPVSISSRWSPTPLREPSRARTDRQMQIEQKIIELQGRFITASRTEENRRKAELQERIEKVKDLRESEWAYGGKGEMPEVLVE
ncbi:hypothetical protein PM082_009587 [Marasmius tenuissimus]|nr:hypothetical protein PM082_009587 [Marasmius tenuissimus]